MVTPCNQPLKTNPFTTYRDPVTGRWTVVEAVPIFSQTDSDYQAKAKCNNQSKVEKIPPTSQTILPTKKSISFSSSLVKYQSKKSAVNLTIPSRIQ